MAVTAIERKLLIDGEWVDTGDWVEVASPYDGSLVGRVPKAGAAEARAAIDAAEAARIGLVHQTAPDAAALEALVQRTVREILHGAPAALAETKGLLAALGPVSPEGYAEAGAAAFARTAAGEEAAEGIAAFKAKRQPRWVTEG